MSEILQVPEKTVKSRLFTARQQLKDALTAQGITSP
jgi:DNA-directed RNA polymerase specialized sigma24 family protein